LCALEQIEALRYAHYIAPDGLAVVSATSVVPVTVSSVSSGAATYPEDVADRLKRAFPRLVYFDAGKMALELGNIRAANIVLLGALSRGLALPEEAWVGAIASSVKEKQRDLNLRAFEIGRSVR